MEKDTSGIQIIIEEENGIGFCIIAYHPITNECIIDSLQDSLFYAKSIVQDYLF